MFMVEKLNMFVIYKAIACIMYKSTETSSIQNRGSVQDRAT